MPQAPLPAPPARLQPQELIRPIVAGTPTPLDVAKSQQQPIDYMARFKEGVEGAHELMKSKQVAEEAAARASSAAWAKSQFNSAQKMSDWIDKNVQDPATKLALKGMMGSLGGMSWSAGGGGSVNPGGNALMAEALRRITSGASTPEDTMKWLVSQFQGLSKLPSTPTTTTEQPKKAAPDNTVKPDNTQKPPAQKPELPQLGGEQFGHTSLDMPSQTGLAFNNPSVQNVSYPDLSGAGSYGGGSNFPSAVNFFQQPYYQDQNLPVAPTMTA